jgi:hypothetical protein
VRLVDTLAPGRALPVELTWLPLSQPQADYNLFLQLLNAAGLPVAQHDSPPNGGYSPTSAWLPRQPVIARHALALPANLVPGNYRLIAGLYNPASGARLAVPTGGDFIELAKITIEH